MAGATISVHDRESAFIARYATDMARLLCSLHAQPLSSAVDALYAAWQAGKVVLFCGNGGSGASCSHIANDFQKGVLQEVGRHNRQFKALCLNDCMPLVSAWANDEAWCQVFDNQVSVWGEKEGVLVACSGSGNSENVLQAFEEAYSIGMTTIGLTSFDGGKLAKCADISIHVPTESMQQAEDAHMVILHLLFLMLCERIKAQ